MEKLCVDKVPAVLVVPDWPTAPWWKPLQTLVVDEFRLPKGAVAYQTDVMLPVLLKQNVLPQMPTLGLKTDKGSNWFTD